MKFTYFRFKNFKGIEDEKLDLSKAPDSSVYTLVGLNESGKTTILEAINYFAYKPESLEALQLDSYDIGDIHNLIPINRRDNFNGFVVIEAGLKLSEQDIKDAKEIFEEEGYVIESISEDISFTQKYNFLNSNHDPSKDSKHWNIKIKGKKKRARKFKALTNSEALLVNTFIKSRIPSILYFPNFLFEFPERIYLDPKTEDPKHEFYQLILQDVLDSLDNNTNLEEHIIDRINSDSRNEKRNLNSLIAKMQKKLTERIFSSWNQIFDRKITRTEVILYPDSDEHGKYIEFNIKDDVDTYRIVERSLGFRWFFVYILLTQFRSQRQGRNRVFFLFDEPASNLHPSAQQELLYSFEKLNRVLYTTHSHYLINPKWLENTFVIKNEAIDYENENDFNSRNTKVTITKYRKFVSDNPSQTSYYQPILDVLDYRPSNLDLVPEVVICEGKNDFYTINYIQNLFLSKSSNIKIVPGVSAGNLETLIGLYLGWGAKFMILLDSDAGGREEKARYIKLYGEAVDIRIFTYQDIDESWKNVTCERLITKEDQLIIQSVIRRNSNKYNKKIFNQAIQELLVTEQKVDISRSSIQNIKKVVDFCKTNIK